jgi:hypothetical protein
LVQVITGDQAGGASSGSTGDIQIYSGWHYGGSGSTGGAYLASGVISGATGSSGGVEIESGDVSSGATASGTVVLQSGAHAGAGPTGSVTIKSGNSTSGNSGDVTIQTGTAGGTRGEINLSGSYVDFQGTNVKNIDQLTGSTGASEFNITTTGTNANIVLNPNGTGAVSVSSSRITNVTDPTNPQDAATKIYVDTNAGGKNYISNKSADVDTSGWATYADAAGSSPVDGTGGSANITWTRSTTTPLRGTADFNLTKDGANRQGEGVSYDFTIDSADKAKVLNISFDYEITAGTFANGDLAVYIYDVTNAQVIQPSGYTIQNSSVSMKQVASFQSASNSTSYRLIIHVASTSANSYVLAFDNFVVGPQNIVNGTPITDWQSYTPASTQGFGTITSPEIYWRRNGSDVEVRAKFTVGTLAASEARFSLPSGLTSADTDILATIQSCGDYVQDSAGVTNGKMLIEPNVTYFTFGSQSGTAAGLTKLNGSGNFNAGKVSFEAKAPIKGWSSSVQMSSDTDTRVVAAKYTSSNKTYTDTQVLDYETKVYDTHGAVTTGSSWVFTCPVPGYYNVTVSALNNANSAGDYVVLHKNGVLFQEAQAMMTNGTNFTGGMLNTIVYLNAGDTLKAFNIGASSRTTTTSTTDSTFSIHKVTGPSLVAENEKIEAVYKIASGVSSSTTQPIDFATKTSDSHSAVTTGSSWKFTAPAAGTYSISATLATTTTVGINVYKNGVDANLTLFDSNATYTLNGTVQINLVAGDYIDLRSASAATLVNNAKYSICIARIK